MGTVTTFSAGIYHCRPVGLILLSAEENKVNLMQHSVKVQDRSNLCESLGDNKSRRNNGYLTFINIHSDYKSTKW